MPSSAKERAKTWKCQVVPRPFNTELTHPDSQNEALKKNPKTKKNQPYKSHQAPPALFGLIKVSQPPPSTAHFCDQLREAVALCSPDLPARPPAPAISTEEEDRQEHSFTHQQHV